MSDSILTLIPVSPDYVPDERSRASAEELLRSIAPAADEVGSEALDYPRFFDAGANFVSVSCPLCHASLDMDWWGDAMSSAFEYQSPHLAVVLPCCGASSSLNDISYSWPQGFARYGLAARNPQLPELSPNQIQQLAEAIGSPIRAVWSHI